MRVKPFALVDAASGDWPSLPVDFLRRCARPTWISQRGIDPSRCRVVVTLLHGNEPSGCAALARWLAAGRTPAVNAEFFVASVDAALTEPVFTYRLLPGHPDANRTYLPPFDGESGQLAEAVLERIERLNPEAIVDLHNNTGHNPAYGVATAVTGPILKLTALFAERLVHSDLRLGTLVEATSAGAPSVVIECGRAGDPAADELAFEGLERLLTTAELDLHGSAAPRVEVLHEPLRICVRSGVRLALATQPDSTADLTVDLAIERSNFQRLPAGSTLGWAVPGESLPVTAVGASGRDVASELFEPRGDRLVTRVDLVPVMMTTNPEIALSDCLFYATRRRPHGA